MRAGRRARCRRPNDRARLAVRVDALRAEQRRDPPGRRPDEMLPPAVARRRRCARAATICASSPGRTRANSASGTGIFGQGRQPRDPPGARRDRQRLADHGGRRPASPTSIACGAGVAVEADHEAAVGRDRDRLAVERQRARARGHGAEDQPALARACRSSGTATAPARGRASDRREPRRRTRSCQRRAAPPAGIIAAPAPRWRSRAAGVGLLPRDAPVAQILERDAARRSPRRRHGRPGSARESRWPYNEAAPGGRCWTSASAGLFQSSVGWSRRGWRGRLALNIGFARAARSTARIDARRRGSAASARPPRAPPSADASVSPPGRAVTRA